MPGDPNPIGQVIPDNKQPSWSQEDRVIAPLARAERARRSSALRDLVRDYGWDRDGIFAALAGAGEEATTLF